MRLTSFIYKIRNAVNKHRNVWTMRLVCGNPSDTCDLNVLAGSDENQIQRIPWIMLKNTIQSRSETLERIDTFDQSGVVLGSYLIEFFDDDDDDDDDEPTPVRLPIPCVAETNSEKEFERFLNIMLKAQESNIKQLVAVIDAVLKPIMGNFNATIAAQNAKVERLEKQQTAVQNKWIEAVEAQANADAGNNSILESVAPVLGALIAGNKGD
jgi:hypothetical protein